MSPWIVASTKTRVADCNVGLVDVIYNNNMFTIFLLLVLFVGSTFPASLHAVSPLSQQENEIVFIPEGYFIMGTGKEAGRAGEDYGVDEEPRHQIFLKAFYIDRYEVTIGQYKEYADTTGEKWVGDTDFPDQYPPDIYFTPAERDNYPVNYVSWNNADAFCQWKGERLPTEEEWEKAARGIEGMTYPWGNEYIPGKTNAEDTDIGGPAPVGSFPDDKSHFGLYDVAGNLEEWTSSRYLPYEENTRKDARYSIHNNAYVLRGGSYLLPGKLFARPARRSIAFPAYSHRMFGFRCARDAH